MLILWVPLGTRSFMRHKGNAWVSGNSWTYMWLFSHAFLHCLHSTESAPKWHSYPIVPILRPISDMNVVQMMTKCSILQNFKLWLKKLMQKLKYKYAMLCGGLHPQVWIVRVSHWRREAIWLLRSAGWADSEDGGGFLMQDWLRVPFTGNYSDHDMYRGSFRRSHMIIMIKGNC